jgi:MurE/MurF fusion protein
VAALTPVPGRLQRVSGAGDAMEVVVDYAHTPDALAAGAAALRPLATARGGRLWCVFGCGGDRDATKRPPMGAIAAQGADRVVSPATTRAASRPAILAQVLAGAAGATHVRGIVDRREAIRTPLPRPRPATWCWWPARATRPRRPSPAWRCPSTTRRSPRGAGALCRLHHRSGRACRLMTLAQAHALLPGSTLVGDGATALARVHTDTRSSHPGDLFVALRGERFDGHDFLAQARAAGAVAVLAERRPAGAASAAGLPGLQVADTLGPAAAGRGPGATAAPAAGGRDRQQRQDHRDADGGRHPARLARQRAGHGRQPQQPHRRAADAAAPAPGRRDLAPRRRRRTGHEPPGRDRLLAALAAPTVALVNNAQREHQEFMKSVEAVARENGAVIDALGRRHGGDPGRRRLHAAVARRPPVRAASSSFGLAGSGADVTASGHWDATWQAEPLALQLHTPAGGADATLRAARPHNLRNALAAAAARWPPARRWPPWCRAWQAFQPVAGRSQLHPARRRPAA